MQREKQSFPEKRDIFENASLATGAEARSNGR